jgi:NADPH:quinone reductase-like Zn-dependent oxidoreductase
MRPDRTMLHHGGSGSGGVGRMPIDLGGAFGDSDVITTGRKTYRHAPANDGRERRHATTADFASASERFNLHGATP